MSQVPQEGAKCGHTMLDAAMAQCPAVAPHETYDVLGTQRLRFYNFLQSRYFSSNIIGWVGLNGNRPFFESVPGTVPPVTVMRINLPVRIMFLRFNRRFKDGKEHRYWSIVENRRCADGKVVQRQPPPRITATRARQRRLHDGRSFGTAINHV
jgi:hypothetical protein